MDINICIDRLGLNANEYKLNQSNPPHSITDWTGTDTQPTEAELTVAWNDYQAEQDSTQYARDRATEYSALNQFEMQFDDQQNNTTTWVDAINDIKARFPK